jgi:PPOX class probable F420-dependent enzyme
MAPRTTLTALEAAFVAQQRVAHLATADEAGSPSLVPVCYAYDGEHFFTPLDEKPKSIAASRLRRVRNILARHEAVLLIDQYSDDWTRLGYIQIHGHADILQPGQDLHTQAITLLRQRYIQYKTMDLEHLPCIIITPRRIHVWGPALQTSTDTQA